MGLCDTPVSSLEAIICGVHPMTARSAPDLQSLNVYDDLNFILILFRKQYFTVHSPPLQLSGDTRGVHAKGITSSNFGTLEIELFQSDLQNLPRFQKFLADFGP